MATVADYLDAGMQQLRAGNYAKALPCFGAALKENDNLPVVWSYAGAVFVMTSNLAPGPPDARAPIGFGAKAAGPAAAADDPVGRFFRPELLNRIDDRIVFRALDRDDAERVLARLTAALERELRERWGAELEITPEARELILEEGFSNDFGVRSLERALERRVREPLGAMALDGAATGAHVRAAAEGGAVVLRRV